MALIALLSFVVMAMLSMGAYAQAPGGQLKTGGDGTMDDQNNQTAKNILDRYNMRFPWNKLNKKYDELKKVDDPLNKADPPKSTTVPEKRNEFQTDGRSAPKDKNQSNTLESEEADKPTKVLAYDSCWVPCGSPTGFFTQSAPAPDPPPVKNAFIQGPFNAEQWKFPRAPEIPYPCSIAYHQDKCIAQDQPLTKRDNAIFERATGYQLPGQGQITTYGLPISDTQYQLIDRENNQRYNELLWDPERFLWAFTGTTQIAGASAGNSLAGNAESSFDNAALGVANGYTGSGALINIANEASGTGPNLGAYYRKVSDAVKQVQLMYHQVYVPLAILFLLPGAVVSQVKAQVAGGFSLNSPEARSPFEGFMRATVAIFLIPATQLIVSYAIDVGNSMAYSVYDPWVNLDRIRDWTHNLSYNPPPETNIDNAILPSNNGQSGQGGQGGQSFWQWLINLVLDFFGFGEGLGGNTPEDKTIHEHVSTLSQILEGLFNMAMLAMSTCLITLCAYQLVYMCYLFLLGPLAAAFYAWPDLQNNSNQKLFRGVFGNWVQAVITLALWRFYWMVILAIMTQRLVYLAQTGAKTNLQWEVAVFTCLLGLMLYVPFNPFDFDPAKAYDAVQKNANGQGGGGQGGGGGAGGGAGGAGGPGGPPLLNSMQNMINQMPEGPARDQLMSAVSGVREGFDRTSYGGAVMGPYRSSDPSGGPRGPSPDRQEAGNEGGERRVAGDVTPPPGENQGDRQGERRQGDSQIAAANLPPVANALVSNVGNFTGGNDPATRTPSLGGDRRGMPSLGVTQAHLDQAQANVGRLAGVLTAMGVPAGDVQKFRDMNSPQAMIAALRGGGGGADDDDDEDPPPRRRPPGDDTEIV